MNGNFLDQETGEQESQSELDSSADQVLDEAYQEAETNSVVNKALERIEQAQLYKTLLEHDLFAPGSARDDIQQAVQDEIRAFVLERLEILVGLRSEGQKAVQVVKAEIPFSQDQVNALQALADRMIKKDPQTARPATPQLMQVAAQEPQEAPRLNTATTLPQVRPVVARPAARAAQPRAAAKKSATASKTKMVEYAGVQMTEAQAERQKEVQSGQVVSRTHKPLPMPSQGQIDQQNAMLSAKTESAFSQGQGIAALLNLAVKASQANNRNVKEE